MPLSSAADEAANCFLSQKPPRTTSGQGHGPRRGRHLPGQPAVQGAASGTHRATVEASGDHVRDEVFVVKPVLPVTLLS